MKIQLKILSILLLFSFCQSIEGVVFISFGGDCTVASVLRGMGLRKSAYPFDWMFSGVDAIFRAIEDDFQFFLDPETLRVEDKIVIDFYGFGFVHDFPTVYHEAALLEEQSHEWGQIRDDWRDFILPIREKYHRRIDRLREVFSGSDDVFIIRYSMKKEEAINLHKLIKKCYPKLNFTLVVAQDFNVNDQDWGLEGIKNFSVFYEGWPFSSWKEGLESLDIDWNGVRFECDDEAGVCDGTCLFCHKFE